MGRVVPGNVRVPTTSKATGPNPKDVVGSVKAAMLYLPAVARAHAADAMMDGAGKYDPYNWRAKKITAMNYVHAAARHLDLWVEGEERADDSGAHHLGHAIASLAILLDAQAHGCLIDDRPTSDAGCALKSVLARVTENEKMRRKKRAAEHDRVKALVHKEAVAQGHIKCNGCPMHKRKK